MPRRAKRCATRYLTFQDPLGPPTEYLWLGKNHYDSYSRCTKMVWAKMATERYNVVCPLTSPMFAVGPPRATPGMLHRELLPVCFLNFWLLDRNLTHVCCAESYPRFVMPRATPGLSVFKFCNNFRMLQQSHDYMLGNPRITPRASFHKKT